MSETKVRLDKWLWAARFYKTRSTATDMINGGKVHYNGQRCKASKLVDVGASVKLRQGYDSKTVIVKIVSDKRQKFEIAQTFYQETDESLELRQSDQLAREQSIAFSPRPDKKPDKKQRRTLINFKNTDNFE
ncbi:ribosome-associated heat shock protein Hsp15 [uncultured Psychrosphaera sp.]|jgi:ribosome-associated heat shock protein Hsp15|uniref:ribosome-associated heat shock protein Hsp15 n=1 Tax=uncultured Psychrosphaera sp. TaxID=1403522 RepID=UPI0026220017|nr:ribosome-associated heat shock protein Hsp15 [uncultured Psychrosphaera sp.]